MIGVRPAADAVATRTLQRPALVLRFCSRSVLATLAVLVLLGAWSVTATALLALRAVEDDLAATAHAPPDAGSDLAALRAERDAAQAQAAAALAELAARHDALTREAAARASLEAGMAAMDGRMAALATEAAAANAALQSAAAELAEERLARRTAEAERDDLADTLHRLSIALDATALARDDAAAQAVEFVDALGALEAGVELERDRQARLLSEIERAAELSIVPLQDMLRAAGVNVERIIEELRRETGGAGGPFIPISVDPAAAEAADPAAAVIAGLEQLRLLQTAAKRMPFAAPVSSPRITSGFGARRDPFNRRLARHDGIDFAGSTGTPILSPAEGVVTFAGVQRGYGRMVKIRHQFGFETLYAHLSKVRVVEGQTVRRGMRIGDMGNTGRSTGTHLHYEVHVDGKPVNPRKFIEAARNVL